MKLRWNTAAFIFIALFALSACEQPPSAPPLYTLSGTVSAPPSARVGVFSSDYWFMDDSFGSGDEDVVHEEFDAGITGSFLPLESVVPSGTGEYSIDLPENAHDMGELIAWVDTNDDGIFDLGTEAGHFPIKVIDGTPRTISGFGYYEFGGQTGYLVSYYDGSMQNTDLEIVGTSGFDFTVD